MKDRIDPVRAEAHARHNVAGQGTVVATSVVAALLQLLDQARTDVRIYRTHRCAVHGCPYGSPT